MPTWPEDAATQAKFHHKMILPTNSSNAWHTLHVETISTVVEKANICMYSISVIECC